MKNNTKVKKETSQKFLFFMIMVALVLTFQTAHPTNDHSVEIVFLPPLSKEVEREKIERSESPFTPSSRPVISQPIPLKKKRITRSTPAEQSEKPSKKPQRQKPRCPRVFSLSSLSNQATEKRLADERIFKHNQKTERQTLLREQTEERNRLLKEVTSNLKQIRKDFESSSPEPETKVPPRKRNQPAQTIPGIRMQEGKKRAEIRKVRDQILKKLIARGHAEIIPDVDNYIETIEQEVEEEIQEKVRQQCKAARQAGLAKQRASSQKKKEDGNIEDINEATLLCNLRNHTTGSPIIPD